MPKFTVDQNNVLEQILDDSDPTPGITISQSELDAIKNTPFFPGVYDYIGGVLVLNQTRYDANELGQKKAEAKKEVIAKQIIKSAEQAAIGTTNAIDNAVSIAAINAILENF